MRPRTATLAPLAVAALLGATDAHARPPTKAECVASNESAQDLEHDGKLLEARAKLAVCVSTSCPGAVREDCAERLSGMEVRIPSLIFDVKDPAGNDVTGVRVTVDGEPLPNEVNGTPVEIDPGQHKLTFEAPDLPPAHKTVIVAERDKGRRVRVVLGTSTRSAAPATATPPDSGHAAPEPSEPPSRTTERTASDGSGARTFGVVLLGAGAVGLVAGGVFGVLSKSTYDHALQTECGNDPSGCSGAGKQDGQTAHTQALVSTVAFAVGGAAALGGAILFFTAPKGDVSVGGSAGPGTARLELVGRW